MNENAETQENQEIDKMSKYEQVVISAREARRLNEAVRSTNKEMKRRVTDVAWERLTEGKVNFTYGEVPVVEEDFEFPELQEQEGDDAVDALLTAPDLIPEAKEVASEAPVEVEEEEDTQVAEDEDADEDDDDDEDVGPEDDADMEADLDADADEDLDDFDEDSDEEDLN